MVPQRHRTFVLVLVSLVVLAVIWAPAPAAAGSGFGLGLKLGMFEPTNAEQSYEAVYDEPGLWFGIESFWKHRSGFGLELGASAFMKDGEGVRLVGGQLVKSGIARELLIVPVLLTAKYHFRQGRAVSPFVGAGFGMWYLNEENMGTGDTFSATTPGFHVVGGIEWLANRSFSILTEFEASSVPDALGEGGTSGHFGEDDIGGIGLNVKLHVNL